MSKNAKKEEIYLIDTECFKWESAILQLLVRSYENYHIWWIANTIDENRITIWSFWWKIISVWSVTSIFWCNLSFLRTACLATIRQNYRFNYFSNAQTSHQTLKCTYFLLNLYLYDIVNCYFSNIRIKHQHIWVNPANVLSNKFCRSHEFITEFDCITKKTFVKLTTK